MKKLKNFDKLLSLIQIIMNNFSNVSIAISFNEILYDFKIAKSLDVLANNDDSFTSLEEERVVLRAKTKEAISFVNVVMKIRYDQDRTLLHFEVENFVYLILHKEYTQSKLTNKKFNKQRLELIKILNKIKNLVYKLNISFLWKIHSIIFIIHFESSSSIDFYFRQISESKSVENVQNDKNKYEIEKILAKRVIQKDCFRRSITQYRVKWLDWENQFNQWINKNDMNNSILVTNYERQSFS